MIKSDKKDPYWSVIYVFCLYWKTETWYFSMHIIMTQFLSFLYCSTWQWLSSCVFDIAAHGIDSIQSFWWCPMSYLFLESIDFLREITSWIKIGLTFLSLKGYLYPAFDFLHSNMFLTRLCNSHDGVIGKFSVFEKQVITSFHS